MKQQNQSEIKDTEQFPDAKKAKSAAIINAVFIGFMIGIVIYSIFKNTLGLLTLIPLFIAFKLINNSKKKKATEK
ncbi:hypothetical protein [uncultured Draconibacterium sp.]|uniref:hypothetical protein n=1 Tax=uncultured Draconibacterium sp. TaxID=1573823 RepID=UPI0026329857|nr:hypothetical protein [uncultured Draconibacterium sp.]